MELDGSEARIELIENSGGFAGSNVFALRSRIITRGDVEIRDGWVDDDHSGIELYLKSTLEAFPGLHLHHNMAPAGTAGIMAMLGGVVVAQGIVIEDNLVLGHETQYGHGHGGSAIWVFSDSSLYLHDSKIRRNSVSTPPHFVTLLETHSPGSPVVLFCPTLSPRLVWLTGQCFKFPSLAPFDHFPPFRCTGDRPEWPMVTLNWHAQGLNGVAIATEPWGDTTPSSEFCVYKSLECVRITCTISMQ